MRERFHGELSVLGELLSTMCGMACEELRLANRVFLDRDAEVAVDIPRSDPPVRSLLTGKRGHDRRTEPPSMLRGWRPRRPRRGADHEPPLQRNLAGTPPRHRAPHAPRGKYGRALRLTDRVSCGCGRVWLAAWPGGSSPG